MHYRSRHVINIISKRAKLFPVLGLVGPRQVGKTQFLQEQWQPAVTARYVTFDRYEVMKRAERRPESFLMIETKDLSEKLIIDEAQKVPTIFDSIKALVDTKRSTAAFTLSGSVEFSNRAGIRESLAGRMGLCRLYPLNLSELNKGSLTTWLQGLLNVRQGNTKMVQVQNWLVRGGMPIFCAIGDNNERDMAVASWLEALCYRDLPVLRGTGYDGQAAIELLRALASKSVVNISWISHQMGIGHAQVKKYLDALEELFLLYRFPSFTNERAAPAYAIFDSALLRYLLPTSDEKFIETQCLKTLIINEIFSQFEYYGSTAGFSRPQLYHYRSRGGAEIDLVLRYSNKRKKGEVVIGIKAHLSSRISDYDLRGIKSFLAKYRSATGYIVAPVTETYKEDDRLYVVPWTLLG